MTSVLSLATRKSNERTDIFDGASMSLTRFERPPCMSGAKGGRVLHSVSASRVYTASCLPNRSEKAVNEDMRLSRAAGERNEASRSRFLTVR